MRFLREKSFQKDIKKNFAGTLFSLSFLYPIFFVGIVEHPETTLHALKWVFLFQIALASIALWYLKRQTKWVKTEGIPVNFKITKGESGGKNPHYYYGIEYLYRYRVKKSYFHSYLFDLEGKRFQYSDYGEKLAAQHARDVINNARSYDLRYRPEMIFDIAYDEPYLFVHIAISFALFYFFPLLITFIIQSFLKN